MSSGEGLLGRAFAALLSEAKATGSNPIETFARELDRTHAIARVVHQDEGFEVWHLLIDPAVLIGLMGSGPSRRVGCVIAPPQMSSGVQMLREVLCGG